MKNDNYHVQPQYSRLIKPQQIIWVLLTYSIGVGLVHHQGGTLDWFITFLGALLAVIFPLSSIFLSAYFDHPSSPLSEVKKEDPRFPRLKELERSVLLTIGLTLLTAGALDVVFLIFRHAVNFQSALILALAFFLSYFTVVPPLRLEKRGYGEISEAILICNLVPALGYALNAQGLHVLLIMLTLPLTLLFMASQIILSLETYAFDQGHRVPSLAIRLGWQKAMSLHNYMILTAFVLIGFFALLGQPWSLTWPMLLPLIIGVFQIIQILRIISGAPPSWKLLKLAAVGSFVIMAYLISFTLWIS